MESTVKQQPPRTIREVFDGLPEGTLAQLIENQLVMSPSPTDSHQKMLNKINNKLYNYLIEHPLGELRIAPYDVHLDPENVFQPDIIFIRKENLSKIRESGLHGAPDLVIELLSPSTSKYDLNQKKDAYERHGVQEYWIVDPKSKGVQGFYLKDGVFELLPESLGEIDSQILDRKFTF